MKTRTEIEREFQRDLLQLQAEISDAYNLTNQMHSVIVSLRGAHLTLKERFEDFVAAGEPEEKRA